MPAPAASHRRSSGSTGGSKRKHRNSDKADNTHRSSLSRKDSGFDAPGRTGVTLEQVDRVPGHEFQPEPTASPPMVPQLPTRETVSTMEDDLMNLDISSFLARRAQETTALSSSDGLHANGNSISPLLSRRPPLLSGMLSRRHQANLERITATTAQQAVPARAPSPPPAVEPHPTPFDTAPIPVLSSSSQQAPLLQARPTCSGYDHLAWTLSRDPPVLRPLYRSFKHLRHRLLLHLLDELAELEEEVRQLDWEIRRHYPDQPTSRRLEAHAEGIMEELYERRERAFKAVQSRLMAYKDIARDLRTWNDDFQSPDGKSRQDYKDWINKNSALGEDEIQFLDNPDLVDIDCRKDRLNNKDHLQRAELAPSLPLPILLAFIMVVLLPSFSWRLVVLASACLLVQSMPTLLKVRAMLQDVVRAHRSHGLLSNVHPFWILGSFVLVVAILVRLAIPGADVMKAAASTGPATVTITTTVRPSRSVSNALSSSSTIRGDCPAVSRTNGRISSCYQ